MDDEEESLGWSTEMHRGFFVHTHSLNDPILVNMPSKLYKQVMIGKKEHAENWEGNTHTI